jgi:hypothetical protein
VPDLEQSGLAVQDDGFNEQLLSVLRSLRPGTRELTDGQKALIAEYEYISERLTGPIFSPPAPQITGFDTEGQKVKVYGRYLSGATVLNVGGTRVTREHFRFREGAKPEGGASYIEADVPIGAEAGPITVFTSGGSATSRQSSRGGDSDEREQVSAKSSGGRKSRDSK